ncbi:MAG: iron-containing alcohol dehydrogenase, partial [Winogradskyella sp.]|nr:iron-containing alcohol dehydrogenase [Winogradskyella sp.]
FIHCIESLNGTFLNAFSKSYGEKALELCKDIFLNDVLSEEESQDNLMMASWHGGMSIAYSQVGIAHALSYGLSFVLGTKHGIGNCIVFDHLEEFYPEGVKLFKQMKSKYNIVLPQGLCADLNDKQLNTMIDVALSLEPLWQNALGKNYKSKISRAKLLKLYQQM